MTPVERHRANLAICKNDVDLSNIARGIESDNRLSKGQRDELLSEVAAARLRLPGTLRA